MISPSEIGVQSTMENGVAVFENRPNRRKWTSIITYLIDMKKIKIK
jgi:hypothetical protein